MNTFYPFCPELNTLGRMGEKHNSCGSMLGILTAAAVLPQVQLLSITKSSLPFPYAQSTPWA